jgi:DNA-binding CsgD family transcriptional regulator
MACAGKHIAMTAKSAAGMRRKLGSTRRGQTDAVASFEHMLQSLNAGLTPRELQVCAHALAGITVAGIATTLGVKDSTVATLRRRAYAKLGVVSLSALFAKCIAQLSGT